jgi:hypothetical protein
LPAAPPRDVEDDLLESFDEPVPLAEPGQPARPAKPPPPLPLRKQEESSVILPDNLELMPGSGAFPPPHPPPAPPLPG